MELFRGQTKAESCEPQPHAWFVLEKGQADQSNDRDPDNRIRHNNAVPKSAAGKIVPLQHAAVCMFSDHRCLIGKRFRDKRLVSCGRFDLFELRDHRRTRGASMPHLHQQTTRRHIVFSEQCCSKRRRTEINCISWMRRLFDSKIESKFASESDWRLCMAASRCTQHSKRATRTKRLLIKKIFRVAQTIRGRDASAHATFPLCCPNSLKNLGKF